VGAALPRPLAAQSAEPTGHLVLIGGGERPGYLMDRIAELAGGRNGRVIVVPIASPEPDEAAQAVVEELTRSGVGRTEVLSFARDSADSWENLERVRQATGIFFTGGDQARLTAALEGTELLGAMLELYAAGGVVCGTSAGATALGELMILGAAGGNQDPDRALLSIRAGAVEVRPGLGFLPEVIVDQHFVRRRRQNRLLAAVLESPTMLAVGIDESTAIVVGPSRRFEVLGENLVVVYDLSWGGPVDSDRNGNLTANGISLHLLSSGQGYDLEARGVEQ
jgi:cyanophycinase